MTINDKLIIYNEIDWILFKITIFQMTPKPDTKTKSDKKKPICEMIKYEGKQFCLNTGLHGYRFIVLPKRTILERYANWHFNNWKYDFMCCRIIWSIVVLLSLTAAVTLLLIAWFEFQRNPVFLVTDSTHFPIWFYPFPSVIICNYNLISKEKAFELAEKLYINEFIMEYIQ